MRFRNAGHSGGEPLRKFEREKSSRIRDAASIYQPSRAVILSEITEKYERAFLCGSNRKRECHALRAGFRFRPRRRVLPSPQQVLPQTARPPAAPEDDVPAVSEQNEGRFLPQSLTAPALLYVALPSAGGPVRTERLAREADRSVFVKTRADV